MRPQTSRVLYASTRGSSCTATHVCNPRPVGSRLEDCWGPLKSASSGTSERLTPSKAMRWGDTVLWLPSTHMGLHTNITCHTPHIVHTLGRLNPSRIKWLSLGKDGAQNFGKPRVRIVFILLLLMLIHQVRGLFSPGAQARQKPQEKTTDQQTQYPSTTWRGLW